VVSLVRRFGTVWEVRIAKVVVMLSNKLQWLGQLAFGSRLISIVMFGSWQWKRGKWGATLLLWSDWFMQVILWILVRCQGEWLYWFWRYVYFLVVEEMGHCME